tara:strand:+ start:132279 stop:132533 length:255 start_codon:yes stop_codon:yes gene_type:complete
LKKLNPLKVTEYIIDTINRLPKGYVFTYEDFITEVIKKEAIIKALNRMAKLGEIMEVLTQEINGFNASIEKLEGLTDKLRNTKV